MTVDRRLDEELYYQLFEEAPIGCILLDANTRIVDANRAAGVIVGHDHGSLSGSLLTRILSSSEATRLQGHLSDASRSDNTVSTELAILDSGTMHNVRCFTSTFYRQGERFYRLALIDVTAEKRAAEALEFMVGSSPEAVLILDRLFGIWAANRAAEEMLQQRPLAGADIREFIVHPGLQDAYRQSGTRLEVMMTRRDGSVLELEVLITPILYDNHLMTMAILRDNNFRNRLQDAIMAAFEQERRRIGQELHDGRGQEMAGVAFLAESLRERLHAAKVDGYELADRLVGAVRGAVQQARALSRGLYPTVLDRQGLVPALKELASSAESLYGCKCEFTVQGSIQLSPSRALHVYRVAQEALANAHRHGMATRATMELTAEPGGDLRFSVRDFGAGLPLDYKRRAGMGLHIMRERLKLLGGTLEIRRHPRGGTLVTCCVPPGPEAVGRPAKPSARPARRRR